MDIEQKLKLENMNRAEDEMNKTLAYVSTGAFALSINYYIDVYFTTLEVWLMITGWVCLIISLLSNVLSCFYSREYSYNQLFETKVSEKENNRFLKFGDFLDRTAVWAFVVGVLILSITIMVNVVAHNVADNQGFISQNQTST